ncbi:MAG: hydantoinase B/oxoprolinase family protein [Synechococcus sp.]
MPASPLPWRFWVDRGGTFTDVVALAPDGRLQVRKVLSEQPDTPGDPAVRAMQALLELEASADAVISELRLGTTVATNALLEGAGDPVLLLTNQGLADVLRIGDQHRSDLFALQLESPPFLATAVEEVQGRLNPDGLEVTPLQLDGDLERRLRAHHRQGLRSCAIALMHAWRYPDHERRLDALARAIGFTTVVCSHQVCALPRLVPRGQTTLVEAAVARPLFAYLDQVQRALGPATRMRVMTSSGALQSLSNLQAKDTILSGPAGGMVGAVAVAHQAGFGQKPLVGFDMGGTSTDVFCLPAGASDQAWERRPETEVAGLRLLAPRLPIHTVAAGGGSMIARNGDRLMVGPRSAGADPGPACYRRGGPLTVTDANLLLGRLQVQGFPAVFGPEANQLPDRQVVCEQFAALAADLKRTPEQLAEGALELAVETMAAAIEQVSLARGHDIRGGVLVAYGGAAGQLACRLARSLGLDQVLFHPLAGVLSAYGMGQARQRQWRQGAVRCALEQQWMPALKQQLHAALADAEHQLLADGDGCHGGLERQIALELRAPESEQGLLVALPALEEGATVQLPALTVLEDAFASLHQQRFGFVPQRQGPLVVERFEVEVRAPSLLASVAQDRDVLPADQPVGVSRPSLSPQPSPFRQPSSSLQPSSVTMHCPTQGWCSVPLWHRYQLKTGDLLEGPALIQESTGCIVLDPGWCARCLPGGELLLEVQTGNAAPADFASSLEDAQTPVDPVDLSLFHHRFMVIAERMGERLRQTSRSVNIRERLDFSCALFDRDGALVANAPHIPVHLGSMGDAVVDLLAQVADGVVPQLQPGDVVISNDPFHGGTHLPDITAITPVFVGAEAPRFFVASRGHHADVGGLTPGSMPPFSQHIQQEGLRLRHWPLVRAGRLDREAWARRLAQESMPPRAPELLLADLHAQVAANRHGVDLLEGLVNREGLERVSRYMQHVQDHAAAAVEALLPGLVDRRFEVMLDNGAKLQLDLQIDQEQRRAHLDFSGSSPQGTHNFHAPLAVTKAAVLYVMRCLVEEPIPLNAGCFRPLRLTVPAGSLLNPVAPAAVVAGNVETSQALCNLLFAALGVMAAAQGTMNNLSFGNARYQYYETIAGGTGAGQGFAGVSGLQCHMTNSRLTDPESLEQRFPVRLECFRRRLGSGGLGRWPGGDGLERTLRFLEPMTVGVLSSSRHIPPFGLVGGRDGLCGCNQIIRADGTHELLPGCVQLEVLAGDCLTLATPGGGGWGLPECP